MMRQKTCRCSPGLLLVGAATLITCTAAAQGLSIGTGAHLVVDGTTQIQLVNANLTNNGNFVPSYGSVVFAGNNLTSPTISGSSYSSFNDLILNRTNSPLVLQQPIAVANNVAMVNGNIDLNNHILDLGTTGLVGGERNDSRITGTSGGYIRLYTTLTAPQAVNPGNLGLEISSAENLGFTELRRAHTPFDVSSLDLSIDRYFQIIPTNNYNLNASLKMYYFEGELNTSSEANLQVWSSSNDGTDWTLYGANSINTIENYAILNGVDTLDQITLSTNVIGAVPLNLSLLKFAGKMEGGQVLLN